MDISVKLCCSLKWLSGVIAVNTLQDDTHSLLLEPYENGILKSNVIGSLTNPNLYLSAYGVLFPDEHVKNGSFESLIHSLARRGGYVLEDNDVIVTDSMLSQENPFREKSHLALLDVLMLRYASTVITAQRVVKAVRNITTFSSSKELPNKLETDHLLTFWLNKVTKSVCEKRLVEVKTTVHDPDPRQRRRNKGLLMKYGGVPVIPHIISGKLYSGVSDGQCLAALMLHYVPHVCVWNDFMIDDHSLSQQHSLINLQFVYDYCVTNLSPPGFHLSPNDWIRWGESGLLDANILALLACLFSSFEPTKIDSPITKKASSLMSQSSFATISSSSFPKSRKSTIVKPPPDTRGATAMKPPPYSALHSQSTGMLSSEVNSKRHLHDLQVKSSTSSVKDASSTISSSRSFNSNSMIFRAPLRSSLNTSQVSALATFNKDNHPLAKGSYSQSFPLVQAHQVLPVPPSMSADVTYSSTSSSKNPISISTSNLNIHQEMLRDRKRSRASAVREWRKSQDIPGHGINQTSILLDLANKSTHSCTTKPIQLNEYEDVETNSKHASMIPRGDSTSNRSPLPSSSLKKSFTLDKHHTLASASRAGLPIIDRTDEQHMDGKTELLKEDETIIVTHDIGHKPKSAGADGSGALMLTNLLQLHCYDRWVCGMPTQKKPIPSSVIDLKVSLMPVLASLQFQNAHMESEAMMHRLKLHPDRGGSSETIPTLSSRSNAIQETAIVVNERETVKLSGSLPDVNNQHSLVQHSETVSHPEEIVCTPESSSCNNSTTPTEHVPESSHSDNVTEYRNHSHTLVNSHSDIAHFTEHEPKTSHNNTGTFPKHAPTLISHSDNAFNYDLADGHVHVLGSSPREDTPKYEPTEIVPHSSTTKIYHPLQDFSFSPISSGGLVFVEQTPLAIVHPDLEKASKVKKSVESDAHLPQEKIPDLQGKILHNAKEHRNTWVSPLHQETGEEDDMTSYKKKEQQIKNRMEERNRARKLAADQRQKDKKMKNINPHHNLVDHTQDTIHFKLSAFDKQEPKLENPRTRQSPEPFSAQSYSGPVCYVKPKTKSNIKIIRNAICAVCLAGEVNLLLKQKTLYELEKTSANHAVILFRESIGFKFRGIYSYNQGDKCVVKIYGTGPKQIKEIMISNLYKYNSGQKEFKEIPTKSLSFSVDALTIKNEYWLGSKRRSSKTHL